MIDQLVPPSTRRVLVAALLLVAAVPPVRSQQAQPAPAKADPQPSFQSQVELVTVDAVVVDRKGVPLRGLTRDDFVVTENGAPQTLTSFEAVVVPLAPKLSEEGPAQPRISSNLDADKQRGRTFIVVFDDIHLSPTQAQRARGAIKAFLETGVGEGDMVTLISSGGSAWWTARMPEGRQSLIDILRRLDGRYVNDPSPDRITEYEAMRIEEYQDEATRLDGQEPLRQLRGRGLGEGRARRAAGGRRRHDARHDPRDRAHARERGVPALEVSQQDHLRRHAAGDPVAGGREGPQGDDPGLPGLRLRPAARGDEGRRARFPAPQRADLLHRHPRPAGAAGEPHRRLRPADRGLGRGGRARGHEPRGRGLRVARARHRRLRGQELERPQRRDHARLERVERLLPARLQPDRLEARRQVPQDRGQAGRRQGQGSHRAGAPRLLRASSRARPWPARRSATR